MWRRGVAIGEMGHNVFITMSLLVPRNGPLPVVLKHSHPLPLSNLCKCQKENLCSKRREEQEVDAGPQSSLAPTCSLPDSSIKK